MRTCEWGDAVQWPNDRNPIFFTHASSPTRFRRHRFEAAAAAQVASVIVVYTSFVEAARVLDHLPEDSQLEDDV